MPDRPTLRFIYNVIRDRNYSRQDYIMNLLGEGGGRGGGERERRRRRHRYREGERGITLTASAEVRPPLLTRLGCVIHYTGPSSLPWKLSGPLRCERVEIIGRDIASRSFFQGLSNDRGIIPVDA